jgi:hypothetical protein
MRAPRDVRLFRRGGAPAPAAGPSLVDQILAYSPTSWIRLTADNVTRDMVGTDTISGAADITGNGHEKEQLVKAAQPLYVNPGGDFDASNDILSAATAYLNGVASVSIFSALNLVGDALANCLHFCACTPGATVGIRQGFLTGTPFVRTSPVGATVSGPVSRASHVGKVLIDSRSVDGSVRLWDNGTPGTESTSSWAGAPIVAAEVPSIGGAPAGTFSGFRGQVLDVIVFAPALSLGDQASVRSLLAALDGV